MEHKLSIAGIRTVAIGDPGSLKGIRLGIQFKNNANFPVDIKVDRIRSSMDFGEGKTAYSPNRERHGSEFTIPPHQEWWIDDYDIEIPDDLRGSAIGKLECKMLYGKNGKLAYIIEIDRDSHFNVSNDGVDRSGDWHGS